MMTLCNWLRRVFAQKTSSLGSTTGYRTTKEGFGIYPTRNRSLIFILRTTPHPCQCFRASKIGKWPATATAFSAHLTSDVYENVSEDRYRSCPKALIKKRSTLKESSDDQIGADATRNRSHRRNTRTSWGGHRALACRQA